MALKIRLKRMGKRNLPFYRLVVVDPRWRRDGKTVADIGWYDPVKKPGQCSIKVKEVYKWLENGAQVSETARSLLKQQGIWDKFRTGEYKNETEIPDVLVNTISAEGGQTPSPTTQQAAAAAEASAEAAHTAATVESNQPSATPAEAQASSEEAKTPAGEVE